MTEPAKRTPDTDEEDAQAWADEAYNAATRARQYAELAKRHSAGVALQYRRARLMFVFAATLMGLILIEAVLDLVVRLVRS